MDIYKEASKRKLRFLTPKGVVTVEQLWSMSLPELDVLVVSLEAELEASGKKSYLTKASEKSRLAKLKFDVALDVLNTLVEEDKQALEAAEAKDFNSKIDSLIAEKEDDKLKSLSVDELKALRK